jgi:predicted phage tail protein
VIGGSYFYVVEAMNTAGHSGFSNVASIAPAASAPNAPTSLTATASGTSIALAWKAPASGPTPASYNVKRELVLFGTSFSTISTVTGTTFTDTGLASGETYSYEVTAVNSVGESLPSNQASATIARGFRF